MAAGKRRTIEQRSFSSKRARLDNVVTSSPLFRAASVDRGIPRKQRRRRLNRASTIDSDDEANKGNNLYDGNGGEVGEDISTFEAEAKAEGYKLAPVEEEVDNKMSIAAIFKSPAVYVYLAYRDDSKQADEGEDTEAEGAGDNDESAVEQEQDDGTKNVEKELSVQQTVVEEHYSETVEKPSTGIGASISSGLRSIPDQILSAIRNNEELSSPPQTPEHTRGDSEDYESDEYPSPFQKHARENTVGPVADTPTLQLTVTKEEVIQTTTVTKKTTNTDEVPSEKKDDKVLTKSSPPPNSQVKKLQQTSSISISEPYVLHCALIAANSEFFACHVQTDKDGVTDWITDYIKIPAKYIPSVTVFESFIDFCYSGSYKVPANMKSEMPNMFSDAVMDQSMFGNNEAIFHAQVYSMAKILRARGLQIKAVKNLYMWMSSSTTVRTVAEIVRLVYRELSSPDGQAPTYLFKSASGKVVDPARILVAQFASVNYSRLHACDEGHLLLDVLRQFPQFADDVLLHKGDAPEEVFEAPDYEVLVKE
ncbi:hypothetical protein BJ508DRAFT_340063 [Ascobolus immersus RN42]|uniref:BTB domain-containing protein n=1 Tax=Ascobolus immersus RN42 TaxID=1160509 RepID=A0A3N4HXZ2_ASCIM|nr:hypothetical protein BJ508DRAFT_340063 [Ascobolus immersus RN42]